MQVEQESGGRTRRRWPVLGVLAVPVLVGVAFGVRVLAGDDDGGGGGGSGGCPDPTFTVDVTSFTDEPFDPLTTPDMHDVSIEGTLAMDSRLTVNVAGISVPMVSSPSAEVYVDLEDPILEPGETASFSGRGTVQLTGSPAVIPDDSAARVDWQFHDLREFADC